MRPLGPMAAGPYGSSSVREVGKWLQKEDLYPTRPTSGCFMIAPLVVLVSTFLLVACSRGPAVLHQTSTPACLHAAVSASARLGIIVPVEQRQQGTRSSAACRAAGRDPYELPMMLAVIGVIIRTAR